MTLCVIYYIHVDIHVDCMWILTALSDGSRGGQISVLSVHVVGAAARVVTQPDTKVLHLLWGFFMDLNESNKQQIFGYFTVK